MHARSHFARSYRTGTICPAARSLARHGRPSDGRGARLLLSGTAMPAGTRGCSEFDAAALADAAGVAAAGAPTLRTYRHDLGSIEVYVEPHPAAPTLVIFAATPVARLLLRLAPE